MFFNQRGKGNTSIMPHYLDANRHDRRRNKFTVRLPSSPRRKLPGGSTPSEFCEASGEGRKRHEEENPRSAPIKAGPPPDPKGQKKKS